MKVIVKFIFVGMPNINIKGAAIGTCVSYCFIFIANLLSLIKYTGVMPNIYKTIAKPVIAALCCGIMALASGFVFGGFGGIGTILQIAVAAIVYFVVLIVLNTFEEDDFASLPKGDKILNILKKLKAIR